MDNRYEDKISPIVQQKVDELKQYRKPHIEIAHSMMQDLPIHAFDMFAFGTLNRSMSLLRGFCSQVEAQNFISAAPLVRLELDTCLRFSAGHRSIDLGDFALKVMEGTPIRKLRDKHGQLMTDTYLVEQMSQEHPWITDVYKQTSGYIHLSEKHIFNSLQAKGTKGNIVMKVSDVDAFIDDDMYLEAIGAFKEALDILIFYMLGWVDWKKRNYGT